MSFSSDLFQAGKDTVPSVWSPPRPLSCAGCGLGHRASELRASGNTGPTASPHRRPGPSVLGFGLRLPACCPGAGVACSPLPAENLLQRPWGRLRPVCFCTGKPHGVWGPGTRRGPAALVHLQTVSAGPEIALGEPQWPSHPGGPRGFLVGGPGQAGKMPKGGKRKPMSPWRAQLWGGGRSSDSRGHVPQQAGQGRAGPGRESPPGLSLQRPC